MTTIEKARAAHLFMLAAGHERGKFVCSVAPDTITQKDWLMCPACGAPQDLREDMGADDEPVLVFQTRSCVHCLFPIDSGDDPAKYDVRAGRSRTRPTGDPSRDWIINRQGDALCGYEDAPQG